MANVNFSENEYGAVVGAAMLAHTRGHTEGAVLLNELAAKMNASLTRARFPVAPGFRGVTRSKLKLVGPLDEQLGVKR